MKPDERHRIGKTKKRTQAAPKTGTTRSRGAANLPAPHIFPRRVLLAVTGLSPQVVTETLYALTQKVPQTFTPTEVHLLTTAEGAERARLTLLSDDPGWFHRLRRDYNLPEIKFDDETIHVLESPSGPISDIRTREENECVADTLTSLIRSITEDEDCALHVSIAGGRKTMGFYAGYALSLFGRPQDRLSHVLVSTPYESNQQFYYPTPKRYVIYTAPPESRPLDARDAHVELAEIPFVRMLHGMDPRLRKGSASFSEVVASAQRVLERPVLEIDLYGRCISAGGVRVRLKPAQLAFLSWVARRTQNGKPVRCPSDGVPEPEYATEYLAEYGHVGDDQDGATARAFHKAKGMDDNFFNHTMSRLRTQLRAALGPEGERRYGIAGGRSGQYTIAVPPENIRWVDLESDE